MVVELFGGFFWWGAVLAGGWGVGRSAVVVTDRDPGRIVVVIAGCDSGAVMRGYGVLGLADAGCVIGRALMGVLGQAVRCGSGRFAVCSCDGGGVV
ncbi:hypothetical protein AB0F17_53675 [Nonomuraea sp. NPDC026600]|uniref:hypothetical protein n=1 Tax=Nonomuraea sp. NPDC026600 TaxID=3155363 RepID=UPI0033EC2E05